MTEIFLYCDGAVKNNGGPGRIGMGVVLWCPTQKIEREYSWGLDQERATNIVAELTAIEGGLERIRPAVRSRVGVTVITDSLWSIQAIQEQFFRTKHDACLARIRALIATFGAVTFRHVKGHTGHVQNERCDALAKAAAHGAKE